MKQAIVSTASYTHNFKVTENWTDLPVSGCQSCGQAESLTAFVNSLDLENQWLPFGYALYYVWNLPQSKTFTAILQRYPAQS